MDIKELPLCRAKGTGANSDWQFGWLVRYGWTGKEKYYIVPYHASDLYAIEVQEHTICPYTGVEYQGKKVFLNDVVQSCLGHPGVIKYGEHYDEDDESSRVGFYWEDIKTQGIQYTFDSIWDGFCVVGNIIDGYEWEK